MCCCRCRRRRFFFNFFFGGCFHKTLILNPVACANNFHITAVIAKWNDASHRCYLHRIVWHTHCLWLMIKKRCHNPLSLLLLLLLLLMMLLSFKYVHQHQYTHTHTHTYSVQWVHKKNVYMLDSFAEFSSHFIVYWNSNFMLAHLFLSFRLIPFVRVTNPLSPFVRRQRRDESSLRRFFFFTLLHLMFDSPFRENNWIAHWCSSFCSFSFCLSLSLAFFRCTFTTNFVLLKNGIIEENKNCTQYTLCRIKNWN